ncbi:hypothetical protein HK103_005157 [Boothiomyces macroporosus]|uniref:Sulfatase N-terminal domain-containing protein n=1 Tax=Boothiomyces macroporosus TaxID=261099 RepID=A0AAD5UJ92_9FUNG|nr:hypothetical protein HK103_005157 [Boothiomyces macroporosus]
MASSKEEMFVMGTVYLCFFSLYAVIFCVNYIKAKRSVDYIPLHTKPQVKRRTIIWIGWYLFYLMVALYMRPSWPYPRMSSNVFFKFIFAPWNDPLTKLGISETVKSNFSFNIKIDQGKKVDDFSFLKRNGDSSIKNVILFSIESGRGDVYPFNYNSPLAKKMLNDKTMKEKKITPFLDSFVKECAYAPEFSTAVSYTIKSILSMQCSMYPYPSDFISEHKRNYYKTCLPTRLKQNGFKTVFMEPCSVFDNLDIITAKMGLPLYGKEEIDKENGGRSPFKQVNYFGYDDEVILPRMLSWIDKQVESKQPFYMASMTNTNHHPWNLPDNWKMREYTTPEYIQANHYLNTVSHTDAIIQTLVEYLKKKDIAKETLLIINGDHGFAFGEKGIFAAGNVLDVTFKVPLMLWTENKKWKPLLKDMIIRGDRTSLDIVPTIMDILNDKFSNDTALDYGYEGNSLLHPEVIKPRFGFANPGLSAIQVRENGLKMAVDLSGSISVYDLSNDPAETTELDLSTFEGGKFAGWYDRARELIYKQIKYLENAYSIPDEQ